MFARNVIPGTTISAKILPMRIILLLALLIPLCSFGRSSGHYSSRSSSPRVHATPVPRISTSHRSNRCLSCSRDHYGKIKRDPAAKSAFRRQHPCPSTGGTSGGCPGYVVDHRQALKRGGTDAPDNMQWQT